MKHARPARRAAALTALATALWACAAGPPALPTGAAVSGSVERIDALIGEAACKSDVECATVPIGASACGGPQAWRPWSRSGTDEAALNAAAAAYRIARQREIDKRGEMSTCQLVTDPGAQCAPPGRCQLRERAGSGLR